MSEHFIKNIEIKNFKCFENFKAEGFGRVNLIGGKNNVGKTAFMEAVFTHAGTNNIDTFWVILGNYKLRRDNLEYINRVALDNDIVNSLEKVVFQSQSNINTLYFKTKNENGKKEYLFKINNDNFSININEFAYNVEEKLNVHFIDNFGLTNEELKEVFESVQKKDKEEILYDYINKFDNNILNFKIIGGDKPQCKISSGEYRDINEFGDGLKHYISIICLLYACEEGYLFIDEIDNGIHYTQLDKLWEIILTISKQQNVQVFATTHSKECIESYARVAKKLEDEEITMTVLARNPKNELKALVYDDKMFYSELEQNHEVRGW